MPVNQSYIKPTYQLKDKVNVFDFSSLPKKPQLSVSPQNMSTMSPSTPIQSIVPQQQPYPTSTKTQPNLIQAFLDKTKGNSSEASKRKAVISMLENGEDEYFIEDTILNKMGYKDDPTLKNKTFMSRIEDSAVASQARVDRLAGQDRNLFRKGIDKLGTGGLAFGGLVGAVAGEAVETTGQKIMGTETGRTLNEFARFTGGKIADSAVGETAKTIGKGLGYAGSETFGALPQGVQEDIKSVGGFGLGVADVAGVGIGAKLLKTGAVGAGKQTIKGVNKITDTVSNVAKKSGVDIEKTGYNLRNTLSGLDEREIFALQNTPKETWKNVIKEAKDARLHPEADYMQTPYHIGAKKASKAFNDLDTKIASNQKNRVTELKNSGIKTIETKQVRSDIVEDIRDTFNLDTITTKNGKVKFNPVKGREVLLDEGNLRDLQAIKLVEQATQAKTPLQMMDSIKKMQNMIYDSNVLNQTSKGMKNFVERSIGKLNSAFKEQVGPKYKNILQEMSDDIKLSQELNRVFKASANEVGNRGELAMKRLASGTTTSSEARNLALKIKERTGIDLIQEARLRQISMDIVGDDRGETLFNTIKSGKTGLIEKAYEGVIEKTPLSKESTALKRAGTKLKSNKTKNANTNSRSATNSNTGNKKVIKPTNTANTRNVGKSNDLVLKKATMKTIKPTIKKPTKASIKKDLSQSLETLSPKNINTIASNISRKLGIELAEVKKVLKKYIDKYGEAIKDKIGEIVDELADKVGARSKFIDNKGKSLDDFAGEQLIKQDIDLQKAIKQVKKDELVEKLSKVEDENFQKVLREQVLENKGFKTASPAKSADLVSEAKRYKSADEFVKALKSPRGIGYRNDEIVWRGVGNNIDSQRSINSMRNIKDSASTKSFSQDILEASNYGEVKPYKIKGGAKILDDGLELSKISSKHREGNFGVKTVEELKSLGYDGYRIGSDELVVINKNIIQEFKPIDFWNKATSSAIPDEFLPSQTNKPNITLPDTKVVDKSGNPLKVYHGTDKSFNKFSLDDYASTDEGFAGKGVYFTNDKAIAGEYTTTGNIKEVYLNIKNPLVVNNYNDIQKVAGLEVGRKSNKLDRIKDSEAITKNLKKKGFDGVIVLDKDGTRIVNEYVIFDPDNIIIK